MRTTKGIGEAGEDAPVTFRPGDVHSQCGAIDSGEKSKGVRRGINWEIARKNTPFAQGTVLASSCEERNILSARFILFLPHHCFPGL